MEAMEISRKMYLNLGRILHEIDKLADINDIYGSIHDILDLHDAFLDMSDDLPENDQYSIEYIRELNFKMKVIVSFLINIAQYFSRITNECNGEVQKLLEVSKKIM